jgi:hypothetical protein
MLENIGKRITFRNGKGWRPLITKNIKTNTTVGVNIRMINSCCEVHLLILVIFHNSREVLLEV